MLNLCPAAVPHTDPPLLLCTERSEAAAQAFDAGDGEICRLVQLYFGRVARAANMLTMAFILYKKSGARIFGVRNQLQPDLYVSDVISTEAGLRELSAEISLSAQFSRDFAQSQIGRAINFTSIWKRLLGAKSISARNL